MTGVTESTEASAGGGAVFHKRALNKESLAERLELELLSGHPPAGAKLDSERALAQRYGVSRAIDRKSVV